jgi:8-oxo-dGTP pyrophosphatase MutT (NUDIX family)
MWHRLRRLQSAGCATRLSIRGQSLYPDRMHPDFQRHIDACNTAVLPGHRLAFFLGDSQVGYVDRGFADELDVNASIIRTTDRVTLKEPDALASIAHAFAQEGHYRFRGEAFDVRATHDSPSLATIDRGALPAFGIMAEGVHLNGLVSRPDGLHLWVARRAADKLLDPGKLDHLAAGGVSAGMTAFDTLVKEAAEEAAIPADLVRTAQFTSSITYAMERPEGLRRDRLRCFDLVLPAGFTPHAADGEVESFELWAIDRVIETVRRTEDFKFNVNLVLIDLFDRLGLI